MLNFKSPDIFRRIAQGTVGLRTVYPIRDARPALEAVPEELLPSTLIPESTGLPQTFLDSTASTKMIEPVARTLGAVMEHYANSHSVAYGAARIATHYFEEAHEAVRRFVNASEDHAAVFVGNGATGAINRLARTLFGKGNTDPRDTVLFSGMEHHANQLPWQKHAGRTIGVPVDEETGTLPLDRMAEAIKNHRGRLRLVAVTGVSNITGIMNDVGTIARLAHEAGAEILVDGAQMAAHKRIDMKGAGIDYLALSGHKIYAPGSPGVLVMPKSASPEIPDEMGGGIILSVNLDNFLLNPLLPAREEAGTPNIVGAILLASALKTLERIGMDRVWAHEQELLTQLLSGLSLFEDVTIYGDTDRRRTERAGVATFSVKGLHHAIAAQALADYFNIAIRNECFCAHPYVKALKKMTPDEIRAFEDAVRSGDRSDSPGMDRVSLGVYTLPRDILFFNSALDWVIRNRNRLNAEYQVNRDGVAVRHDGWQVRPEDYEIF